MVFSAFVARRELLRDGRRCPFGADHRLALLVRRDGAPGVRGTVAPAAHVDRPRGRRRRRGRARRHGIPAVGHARGDHQHRRAAPSDPRCSSPSISASRSAPCRGTCSTSSSSAAVQPGWPLRCTARPRVSTRSRSTRTSTGGPGECELAHRELRRFSERHLGRGAHVTRRDPGATTRRAAQLTVRGRWPPRRRWLPRDRARGRQRDPVPVRRRRLGRALPTTPDRRSRTLRGRRRLLRRHRSRGSHRATAQPVIVVGGGNSAGQAAIYLAQQGSRRVDRHPRAPISRTACRTTSSSASTPTHGSRSSSPPRCARSPAVTTSRP